VACAHPAFLVPFPQNIARGTEARTANDTTHFAVYHLSLSLSLVLLARCRCRVPPFVSSVRSGGQRATYLCLRCLPLPRLSLAPKHLLIFKQLLLIRLQLLPQPALLLVLSVPQGLLVAATCKQAGGAASGWAVRRGICTCTCFAAASLASRSHRPIRASASSPSRRQQLSQLVALGRRHPTPCRSSVDTRWPASTPARASQPCGSG